MKTTLKSILLIGFLGLYACNSEAVQKPEEGNASPANEPQAQVVGQSGVQDATSAPNIVQTAVGSKDHTTLVTAVKAAELVDALSNAGPFTVFAPTNAAFDKLPAGTVDGLLKPEKKGDLSSILEYHTYVGSLKTDYMQDGQEFEMVNGGKVKITKKDGKTFVNNSEIVASISTANGMIHVINDVLLPK
ncbi:MAG: fasciclin domain-containing protein [Bacteroidetes bacterium]|nr:fasciclin domain-containing protein [Bacteroidota bacterium]